MLNVDGRIDVVEIIDTIEPNQYFDNSWPLFVAVTLDGDLVILRTPLGGTDGYMVSNWNEPWSLPNVESE